VLHFWYFLHDVHLPECFELQLIFGFEQPSFGCRKKNKFNIPNTNFVNGRTNGQTNGEPENMMSDQFQNWFKFSIFKLVHLSLWVCKSMEHQI